MLKFVGAFLLMVATSSSALAKGKVPDFTSVHVLNEHWHNEDIYSEPKDKEDLMGWSGQIYDYQAEKCFKLAQKSDGSPVTPTATPCEAAFLAKALKPYEKIGDFKKFETRFLGCLSKRDQNCLRGLISKTLQVSFGVEGLRDRRDLIFETWKEEDFKRLEASLKKGTIGSGDSRTFPPEVDDEGMGYRGEFRREKGIWLLKSYLAGD